MGSKAATPKEITSKPATPKEVTSKAAKEDTTTPGECDATRKGVNSDWREENKKARHSSPKSLSIF